VSKNSFVCMCVQITKVIPIYYIGNTKIVYNKRQNRGKYSRIPTTAVISFRVGGTSVGNSNHIVI